MSINGYVGEVDDSWSIIGRKWSCSYQFNQSDHSNLPQRAPIGYIGGRKDGCPYLNTLSYAIGVIICYLDPKIKVCPSYASLLTGGKYELVQNTVKVTRQTKGPRTNVALCTHAPLPIPNSNFLSWHRFVETIEHHLMTGIEVDDITFPFSDTYCLLFLNIIASVKTKKQAIPRLRFRPKFGSFLLAPHLPYIAVKFAPLKIKFCEL